MRGSRTAIIVAAFALLTKCPANAVCIYKGQMYAKTTLSQEFSDSKWVVRAKVTAADNHWSDYLGGDNPWTIYHLRVLASFKGELPATIELFTYRDSGGFYLDKGAKADIGGEYLLFLNPVSQDLEVPAVARSATVVNYSCGQSRAWTDVNNADREELAEMSQRSKVSANPDHSKSPKSN